MTSKTNPLGRQVVRNLRIRYLIVVDAALLCLAVVLAVYLRLEYLPDVWRYLTDGNGWSLFISVLLVRLPLYYKFDLFNRLWRYASMETLRSILLTGAVAPVGIAILNFGLFPQLGLPYSKSGSVWLLEALCSVALLAGSRLALRAIDEKRIRSMHMEDASSQRTLIVGAGDAGAMIFREIFRTPELGLQVVGFVDDDVDKRSSYIDGTPIVGNNDQILDLIRDYRVEQVIIAMPTAPGKVIREVVKKCEAAQIRPRIVPSLHTLVNGSSSLSQLRPVEIDDLLRREPIETDTSGIYQLLHNRRIMVTGGGGSIGRELCRQIIQCAPAELIILGHGENSVFEIEQELRKHLQDVRLTTSIADIRMSERLQSVFIEHRPHVVFHTAAHKHVPLMEANPGEAVTNNILGTHNLLEAAQIADVQHFVMISSDKAVNPTSVMGASKRAAELLVLDAAKRSGKAFQTVRFGNVLGSRGSVVHTFKHQIATGGPVTVTDERVTRYFMTIPEAVQLTLQAAILGHGGEIFMLDMGEPIRIVDLAHDLIRLSGLEVGRDIDIVFTGMRPGEKMHEELFLPNEPYRTTAHAKIRVAVDAGPCIPDDLAKRIEALGKVALTGTAEKIRCQLAELIPEYRAALVEHLSGAPPVRPAEASDLLHDSAVEANRKPGQERNYRTGVLLPVQHYHSTTGGTLPSR